VLGQVGAAGEVKSDRAEGVQWWVVTAAGVANWEGPLMAMRKVRLAKHMRAFFSNNCECSPNHAEF
jgi:hypothetical protein